MKKIHLAMALAAMDAVLALSRAPWLRRKKAVRR